MLLRFLIIFAFLLSSCSDYMNINSTIKKIVKMGESKYKLECFGSGAAAPEKINSLSVTFRTYQYYDYSNARKLIIDFAEDFIKLINNSPDVKQYINNQPVSEKNLSLFVVFKDCNDEDVTELPAIYLSKGYIIFYKLDPLGGYTPNFEEKYEDAYFKVYGNEPPKRF